MLSSRTLVWDLSKGSTPREFAGSDLNVFPVALSPCGASLAMVADEELSPRLFDARTFKPRVTLSQGGGLDAMQFSADGRLLVTSHRGQGIRLWKGTTGEPWRQLVDPRGRIYAMAFTPDGRTLITGGRDTPLRLWELETASPRRELVGHAGPIFSLAVSPDGRILASAGEDGVVMLHDLTRREAVGTKDGGLPQLWETLADRDAGKADRVAGALLRNPDETASWLADRMKPVVMPREAQLHRWIADLNHARFPIRREAARQLEQTGNVATLFLRQSLIGSPTLEVRRRVEQLLSQIEDATLSAEERRALRAIEVLEHLATADSRRLLQRLASGAEGASQTEAARSALARLPR